MSFPKNIAPLDLFRRWFEEATAADIPLANAASLATADASGRPSARMVLLKGWGDEGFAFYTNLGSQKAREIDENPQASLLVHWKELGRQIRISGAVQPISDEEADAYFATRDRKSKIGAWASRQSHPFPSGENLAIRVARAGARFGLEDIPRPTFWGGYRVIPDRMEFWSEGRFRLHTRRLYVREGSNWTSVALQP